MLRRCLIRWMNLALILVLRFLLLISQSNPQPQVDLIRSEAKVPDAGPRGRHRLHDEEREEAFRGGACQRVQHLLGSLHLVHLPSAGGDEAGAIAQPVRFGEHHEGEAS